MKKKMLYLIPLCEEVSSLWDAVLCESDPSLGGTEDVGYEDWVLNG